MGLSFRQVVDVLVEANTLSPDRRDRFISRLKQWQKMEFPEGVNVGKGARADYGAKQLFQLAFHMRLLALGLTPERAQVILTAGWERVQHAITSVTIQTSAGDLGGHYLLVRMDALTELKDGRDSHEHVYVYPVLGSMIADALAADDEGLSEEEIRVADEVRLLVLNAMVDALVLEVDSIVWRIWIAMKKLEISPSIFTKEIGQWVKAYKSRKRQTADETRATVDFVNNLADVEICLGCFAGELLGLKEQQHGDHSEA